MAETRRALVNEPPASVSQPGHEQKLGDGDVTLGRSAYEVAVSVRFS